MKSLYENNSKRLKNAIFSKFSLNMRNKENIADIVQDPIHKILCKGVSQKSGPVDVFVQIIEMPQDMYHSGETRVLCPRLRIFYIGDNSELRCYEGDLTQYTPLNSTQYKDSGKCPYLKKKYR